MLMASNMFWSVFAHASDSNLCLSTTVSIACLHFIIDHFTSKNIGGWNTSGVTNMEGMFRGSGGATVFNQVI